MSAQMTNYLSAIKNTNVEFQSIMIIILILFITSLMIWYIIYTINLQKKECNYMNTLYSSIDGNIKPINNGDEDCLFKFYDYYVKTAFNACSGGSYKNDFVNICNLIAVIKQGVRCLDFEVYSVDNQPVVATSTTDDFYVKETYNSVNFGDVMSTIQSYAFSGGSCPNPTDPLIIHLRIRSNNQQMYTNLANIFKSYDSLMLGKEYSFENSGKNLGSVPLLSLQNKIILIVDKINNAFLENQDFLEYVNLTSNSVFMRIYDYYNVKNNPDISELTDYNKKSMTIVLPDAGVNPGNPSGLFCRALGCQMVAMRYQYVDNFLEENAAFFDSCGYAFCLKPEDLRYKAVTIEAPTPQNPAYSYQTRTASTDYYNFNY